MNLRKILYVVMIGFILLGCTKRNQVDITIDYADSLMDYSQDSAMVSLRILDSLKSNKREMSEAQQMRYDLIYAKAMNKAFVDFTTDSVMKNVVKYYDKVGSANDKMLAHYLLGCTYRDLKNAPASLASYRMAAECADTTDINCNYDLLAIVYGQIGIVFMDLAMPNRSVPAFGKAIHFASIAKDTILRLQALSHQAIAYRMLGDSHSFLKIKGDIYKQYLLLNMEQEAALEICSTICEYVKEKKLFYAKYIIENYEKKSGLMDREGNVVTGKEIYYNTKGNYFLEVNQINLAIDMFEKLKNKASLMDEKEKAYSGLARCYSLINKNDSVAKYVILAREASDSCLFRMANGSLIQSLYDYEQVERKRRDLESTNKVQKYAGIFVVVIAGLCAFFVLVFIRQRNSKRILFLNLRSEMFHNKMLQYLQDNQSLILVKAQLEQSLKLANDSRILLQSEAEQKIKKLEERIHDFEGTSVEVCTNANETLKNSEIRRTVDLKAARGECISDYEMNEVSNLIKTVTPKFYAIICQTELLTPIQVSVCLLVRLFFSSSDLQNLLGISSGYASNVKRNVSKKIFGVEMSPKEFEEKVHKFM